MTNSDSRYKNGKSKAAVSAYNKKYAQENMDKIKAKRKEWYWRTREVRLQKHRESHHRNKHKHVEKVRAASRAYSRKLQAEGAHLRYREANREKLRAYHAEYRERNKESLKAKRNQWVLKNKDSILERKRAYERNRRETDIQFRLKCRMRSRIIGALKYQSNRKQSKTVDMIGCSIEFLKGYLEARFTNGMSWDNIGAWHVDHIIPCAEFDLSDEDQRRKCFHYSNLRPLWGSQNIRKGSKKPPTHQAELI